MADDSGKRVSGYQLSRMGLPTDGIWFYRQEGAIKFSKTREGSEYKYKFAWDNPFATNPGSKIHGLFKTEEEFWETLLKVADERRHAYEWFEEGFNKLLYGDAEWEVEIKDPAQKDAEFAEAKAEGRRAMERWKQEHRSRLEQLCGITPLYLFEEGSRMKIKDGKGTIKISYHIIIRNVFFRYDDEGRKLAYQLMCLASNILPKNGSKNAMDPAPYGKNQKYRTNLSSKASDATHTPLKICCALSDDPDSITNLDTLVGRIPESAFSIDKLEDNVEFQRFRAECTGGGSTGRQSYSRQNAEKGSRNQSTSMKHSGNCTVDSLHEVLKNILLCFGDCETRVEKPTTNGDSPNGFKCQCLNSRAGRPCLWNFFNVHHSNNSRIFVDPVDEDLKVFTVKLTCYSPKCRASNGNCRTGIIATLSLDEDQTFHLRELDESVVEHSWKPKVLSYLRTHFADEIGDPAIDISNVLKELGKKFSVETDFFIERREQFTRWIRGARKGQLEAKSASGLIDSDYMEEVDDGDEGRKGASSGRIDSDHMEEVDDGDEGSKDADEKGCNQGGYTGNSGDGGDDRPSRSRKGKGSRDSGGDGDKSKHDASEFGNPQYKKMKIEFEKECFKIKEPFMYARLETSAKKPSYLKHHELRQFYSHLNYYVQIGKKRVRKSFIEVWLRDPNKRQYDRIESNCFETTSGCFNIWPGFLAAKLPPVPQELVQELVQPFIRHVREVLASGDEEMTQWLLDWFANMIQRPHMPSHVLIIFRGLQGCGKGILFDFFRKTILGESCSAQTDNPEQNCFGKHASSWINAIMYQIDEARSMYEYIDRVKNAVTASERIYEGKNKAEIPLPNLCNFVITTNNKNPVRIDPDDRRCVLIEVSRIYKGNQKYWVDLASHLSRQEVSRAIFQYMMGRDLTKYPYDFQHSRPRTTDFYEAQSLNIPVLKRFTSGIINDAMRKHPVDGPGNASYQCQNTQHLFEQCKAFALKGNYHFTHSLIGFSKDLLRIQGFTNRKSNGRTVYTIDCTVAKKSLQDTFEYDEEATLENLELRYRLDNFESYVLPSSAP